MDWMLSHACSLGSVCRVQNDLIAVLNFLSHAVFKLFVDRAIQFIICGTATGFCDKYFFAIEETYFLILLDSAGNT